MPTDFSLPEEDLLPKRVNTGQYSVYECATDSIQKARGEEKEFVALVKGSCSELRAPLRLVSYKDGKAVITSKLAKEVLGEGWSDIAAYANVDYPFTPTGHVMQTSEGADVRYLDMEGVIWISCTDVASALGYGGAQSLYRTVPSSHRRLVRDKQVSKSASAFGVNFCRANMAYLTAPDMAHRLTETKGKHKRASKLLSKAIAERFGVEDIIEHFRSKPPKPLSGSDSLPEDHVAKSYSSLSRRIIRHERFTSWSRHWLGPMREAIDKSPPTGNYLSLPGPKGGLGFELSRVAAVLGFLPQPEKAFLFEKSSQASKELKKRQGHLHKPFKRQWLSDTEVSVVPEEVFSSLSDLAGEDISTLVMDTDGGIKSHSIPQIIHHLPGCLPRDSGGFVEIRVTMRPYNSRVELREIFQRIARGLCESGRDVTWTCGFVHSKRSSSSGTSALVAHLSDPLSFGDCREIETPYSDLRRNMKIKAYGL